MTELERKKKFAKDLTEMFKTMNCCDVDEFVFMPNATITDLNGEILGTNDYLCVCYSNKTYELINVACDSLWGMFRDVAFHLGLGKHAITVDFDKNIVQLFR